jgi:hypothetical protein
VVKLTPKGSHKEKNCSHLGRGEGRGGFLPFGDNFAFRGKLLPWGLNFTSERFKHLMVKKNWDLDWHLVNSL